MSTIKQNKTKTYIDAGVNIDEGDQFINDIKPMVKKTNTLGADTSLKGFGAVYDLSALKYRKPVLISSTDGVGTTLEIAIKMKMHSTIGIDLVAMCVNDILAQGALPLYFLDYYATGKLNRKIAKNVLEGIVDGCLQANIALIGGETAEMPGIYDDNKYDLAGFSVGIIEKDDLKIKNRVKDGNIALALSSSGFHSNGFSMIRYILKQNKIDLLKEDPFDLSVPLGKTLLTPTKIYTKSLNKLHRLNKLNGLANITGGGLITNPQRILPNNLSLRLHLKNWKLPNIFKWMKQIGGLEIQELLKVFNCGIGMLLYVDKNDVEEVINYAKKQGEECFIVGEIIENSPKKVFFEGNLEKWSRMD